MFFKSKFLVPLVLLFWFFVMPDFDQIITIIERRHTIPILVYPAQSPSPFACLQKSLIGDMPPASALTLK